MFTGIIEEIAEVVDLKKIKGNLQMFLKSKLTNELRIDQSISHNGVCLTVIDINDMIYSVVAINETLSITNLAHIAIGDKINIERAMKLGDRLDGHMVQGHVDQVAKCLNIKEENGSFLVTFNYESSNNITVRKGSICVNGVSLTIVESKKNSFSVAIIPYTYKNTNFHKLKIGSLVNIEFDILGKYISKLIKS